MRCSLGSRVLLCAAVAFALAATAMSQARATEIWMTGGVSTILNQASEWRGVRSDYSEMWRPDASWRTVAAKTAVILLPVGHIQRAASDAELSRAFDDLKRRHIGLAVELTLLTPSDSCKYRGEGYLDSVQTLEAVLGRIKRDGGELRYIAMDEPFYYGQQYTGPNACHETTAEIARRVAIGAATARRIFPDVQIGDEEVVSGSRPATDALVDWADAFRAATGLPLAFLHTDLNWSAKSVGNLKPLAAALAPRRIALGVIYDADASPRSDQAWADNTSQHFTEVESGLGLHPDHAVFQTWVHYPTKMLPETQPGTLTNVALRYLQPATALSLTRDPGGIAGRLTGPGGRPIAGAPITVEALDVAGLTAPSERQWTGTVPQGAVTAMIGLRVDTEGSCVCAAPLRRRSA